MNWDLTDAKPVPTTMCSQHPSHREAMSGWKWPWVFRLGFAGGSAQPDPLVGIETPGMGEGEWITRQRLELGARRTKEIGARGLRIVIRLDRTERVGNGAEKRPWTGCQDICAESMAQPQRGGQCSRVWLR